MSDPFDGALDVPLINLQSVKWPTVENYGFDHHKSTAFISRHMSNSMYCTKRDQDILWLAAILHDIGRTRPFGMSDVGHDVISANLAKEIIKKDPSYWNDSDLIHQVCNMIANHSEIKDENLRNDPKFLSLLDADLFEVARISPKTPEGLKVIKDRFKTENLHTPAGKDRESFRRWMVHRGW